MKKVKLNIPNPFAPIAAYLRSHLGRAKSEQDAEKRVLSSLNIVGRTFLIVGLVTSFTFIVPTVLQIAGVFLPSWAAIVLGVFSCALIATIIDLSLGVNVPFMFFKWSAFFQLPNWRSLLAAAPISLLVFGQCSLSMYFSWNGNTHTTEWLLEDENPSHNTATITALDSAKHAAEKKIRKEGQKSINAAKKRKSEKLKEAKKGMQNARFLAAQAFPLYANSEWHKTRYNRRISKARQDSSDIMQGADLIDIEMSKLDDKVRASNANFDHSINAEKAAQQKLVDKYERKLKTYRLLLRDLGYFATLGFIVISLIIVIITGASGKPKSRKHSSPTSKKKYNNDDYKALEVEDVIAAAEIKSIRQHLSQDIRRCNEAIEKGKETSTYANKIVSKFTRIKDLDIDEYNRCTEGYKKIFIRDFGAGAVYDDATALPYT